MKKEELDYVLVPVGIFILLGYHLWLLYRILKHPTTTVIGINSMNRRLWVKFITQDPSKYGVLAVQTLRNNIMASTLLASTAIMLSSVIAVLMTNGNSGRIDSLVFGNTTQVFLSVKFFAIILCFLLAFLLNVQSIRYYSHGSLLINVPFDRSNIPDSLSMGPSIEYVAQALNRGSYFWSLGLRAFYFSLPLFLWVFGPVPMLTCCLVLVSVLYFLDVYDD
ncbi:hypothetical protein LUZ60_011727 [Juncus effusus]|nr:hypothetical protein LUZ60_011727 [Juncus effusus]